MNMTAWRIAGIGLLAWPLVALGQTTNRLLWSFPTSKYVFSSPAIAEDGTVYIGSGDGRLYALNPRGTQKWSFRTEAEIQSSPAIGRDGTIYFGSADRKVYALNPDGTERWHFLTGGLVLCSPTLGADGTIYIGSRDGTFYAFRADGSLKWQFDTGQYYNDMPAVIGSEGTIYIGAAGKLYAFSHNGERRWELALAGSWIGPSIVVGSRGVIYASVAQTGPGPLKMFAVSHRGEKLWDHEFGPATAVLWPSFPAIARDGTIFIATSDSFLHALNADGSLRWKVPATRSQSSPALSDDGKIYLNSGWDFRLLCYGTDGAFQWDFVMGGSGSSGGVASFPTLRNGVVYVGSGNGSVYALAASGELEAGAWPSFARDHNRTGRDIQCGIEALIDQTTGQQRLRCTVEPGRFYRIEGSSDLRVWRDCTNFTSTNAILSLSRPSGADRYYRLVTQ